MAAHDVNSAHLAACSLEDASARFAFDDMRRASTCLREALDEGDMAAALVFMPPLREAITSLAATLLRLEREGQKSEPSLPEQPLPACRPSRAKQTTQKAQASLPARRQRSRRQRRHFAFQYATDRWQRRSSSGGSWR